MVPIFLLERISGFVMRFIDLNGFDIPNVSLHSQFILSIQNDGENMLLSAFNHRYNSRIPLLQDPCIYNIEDERRYVIGFFDICRRSLQIRRNNFDYNIHYSNGNYVILKDVKSAEDSPIFRIESKSEEIPDERKFKINVFIFNDHKRLKYFGDRINQETKEILDIVDQIYSESGASIRVQIAGILNIQEEIKPQPDILCSFRDTIEPIRYNPKNLDTPLGTADLIILLSSDPMDDDRQGMTYYGGSVGLSRSYSVVYAGLNESKYFTAKKLAHEIAHSLGVHHDKNIGFLMESSTCSECNEEKRHFSKESIETMNKFINEHSSIFLKTKDLAEKRFILSVEDAIEFVKSHRKHSFNEIVRSRLNGKLPNPAPFSYYLTISMVVYALTIFTAIFYFK